MRMETEHKIHPVTHTEALAALWRIKLRLGQYPIHILWTEKERPTFLSEIFAQKIDQQDSTSDRSNTYGY